MPNSPGYRECYAYLEKPLPPERTVEREPDYHVVFLTSAPHFDYTDGRRLMPTMIKHPASGAKNGTFGHAWLYLRGIEEGEEVVIEGGHSGELGEVQPTYFNGVMNLFDYGYVDPTPEQRENPRHEPDPIKYLWAGMADGYFQEGTGGYRPTFAAMVPLTKKKYHEIKEFISPENYPYGEYAITRNQCTTLVAATAAKLGLEIEHRVDIPVNQTFEVIGRRFELWTDPEYSVMTFGSPDFVEKSLMELVREGDALDATEWYFRKFPDRRSPSMSQRLENVYMFPARLTRYLLFR